MRHAIVVVGNQAQREEKLPRLRLRDDEAVRTSTWFACTNQDDPSRMIGDKGLGVVRWVMAPVLAYRFFVLVRNTKFWAGKRPLVLVRDRGLASRIAAYAGSWGGGNVVMPAVEGLAPLGPTRFILEDGGNLTLRVD